MVRVWPCCVLQYGRWPQIQEELKCILRGAQRIRIGVDIVQGHPLQQDRKMMYLDSGLLEVL